MAPGPDLVWLTGYRPTAITERLTMLVLAPGPRADTRRARRSSGPTPRRRGRAGITVIDWADATDPYPRGRRPARPDGAFGISDSAWALHLLGLQRALPGRATASLTEACRCCVRSRTPTSWRGSQPRARPRTRPTSEILQVRFAGGSETEVAADLAGLLRQFGHEQVDFTVVGSGPNGANPHHEAGDRVIQPGDTVVLDFGGLMYGYGSDTTPNGLRRRAAREVREVHEVVRRAQQAALEAVRPGVACQDIDRVARAVITDAGYGEEFIHRTGHGIGVTTHEPPYMVEGEEQPSCPGCASPSSRASISPGGSACASRTSSR